jgi:integrase
MSAPSRMRVTRQWHAQSISTASINAVTSRLAGLRADELLLANVGDIRTTEGCGVIHVRGKGGTDRRVPVEQALVDVIDGYLKTMECYASLGIDLVNVGPFPGDPDPAGFVRRLGDELLPRAAEIR